MKKLIAVLLSILMIASILPISALAATTPDTAVTETEATADPDIKNELADIAETIGSIPNPWADAEAGTMEYYMGVLFTLVKFALTIAAMAVYTFDNGNIVY